MRPLHTLARTSRQHPQNFVRAPMTPTARHSHLQRSRQLQPQNGFCCREMEGRQKRTQPQKPNQTYLCFELGCGKMAYCKKCQKQHLQHEDKLLNLQEVLDMLEGSMLSLRKKGTDRLGRTVQILEQYTVLREFKTTFDKKWIDIESELLSFLENTETLINELSAQKKSVESDMDQIQRGGNKILDLYNNYQLNSKGTLQQKSKNLENTDQQWKNSINQVLEQGHQLKDYAMKMIEVLTDSDYDVYNKNINGEASKFATLHQEVKEWLTTQPAQQIKWGNSMLSQSTKIDLKGRNSQLESQQSCSEFRGTKYLKNNSSYIDNQQGKKKKSQTQIWLSKINDLYQVRES